MSTYLDFESEYDRFPETRVDGFDDEAFSGWPDVCAALVDAMGSGRVMVVDCYPGTNDDEVLGALRRAWKPELVVDMREVLLARADLARLLAPFLTDDRVRGVMYPGVVENFIDGEKLAAARSQAAVSTGRVLVYGFAASLVTRGDLLVYADLARWEIQLRYRAGMPNYLLDNADEDILHKFKCGYFVEWRIADRHKARTLAEADWYLDTNTAGEPHLVSVAGLRAGLGALVSRPFRLVPYFDPGVWGGHWMQEVCGLPDDQPNYAWSFDGVPEENSVLLRFGSVRVESPAMNLTKLLPRDYLGERTFSRFGAEVPIRFDFLDTMGGQNLSLQVHPDTGYIHERFGMSYTQDESYYILDAEPGAGVFLGLREGIDPVEMVSALEDAQHGGRPFDADRFVNRWPAAPHDHFLIPAGTVHCSSAGCMVLEVSATPYIFTFKLWDWGRLGMDGVPRPIHIEDGKRTIRWDRTTTWVRDNLVDRFEVLSDEPGLRVTRTGLHELEFIETRTYDIVAGRSATVRTGGEYAVLNLVAGRGATIASPTGAFEPLGIHYVETVQVPAAAGDIELIADRGEPIKVLVAQVRF